MGISLKLTLADYSPIIHRLLLILLGFFIHWMNQTIHPSQNFLPTQLLSPFTCRPLPFTQRFARPATHENAGFCHLPWAYNSDKVPPTPSPRPAVAASL